MLKGIKIKEQDDENKHVDVKGSDKFLNRKTEREEAQDYNFPTRKQNHNGSGHSAEPEFDFENLLDSAFDSFIKLDNKSFLESYGKLEQFKNSRANKLVEKPLEKVGRLNNNINTNEETTGNPFIDVDLDNDDDDDKLNPNINEMEFDKFKADSENITNQMKGELIKMQQFNQFENGLTDVYFSKNQDKELKDQLQGVDSKDISKTSKRSERRKQTVLASCERCFGAKLNEYSIISNSDNVYVAYPYREGSITEYHLVLSTMGHMNSQAGLEENIYQEIRNYMKSIVSFNLNRDMTTVFLEYSQSAGKIGHFEIEAVPIKHKLLEDAKMYFKKEFTDQDYEWATNKKLIDTTPYRGNLTKILNENFSYVNVDFNGQGGWLHPIEDERRFNQVFLKEILCPMLKLSAHEVKYPKKLGVKELVDTVEKYKNALKDYDWTLHI
jgi:hypothetical protein